MKPLLAAVLIAGCSRERREPPPVKLDDTHGKRSIDVSVRNAPITIRGVEIVAGRRPGELELGYRVDAADNAAVVPARIMCRIADRNLIYPINAAGKVAGPRLTSMFRPDPFNEAARACEVAFMFRANDADVEQTVAHACWQDGTVRDGKCPPTTFVAPAVHAAGSIALERAGLELRESTAVVTGLFTLVGALAPGRHFGAAIVCEDSAGKVSGDGDLAFVPLDGLPVGASLYGPLTFYLDRTPAPEASCALRVVSRSVMGSPTGEAEQTHGQYCLTARAVRAGPC